LKKIFLILILLSSCCSLQADWKVLQPGLEYRRLEERAHFFRIDPEKFRIDLLLASDYQMAALTAERFRQRSGALLVVNGGFFDEAFRSLGLLQRKGETVNPIRNATWGVFLLKGDRGREPAVIHRNEWKPEGVVTAIQVGPRLIVDGKIPPFKESAPHRRSAIGITKDGWVEIAVSEGALTLQEWARELQTDCVQALNLDGGGSTQLSVSLPPDFSVQVGGMTGVPNALAVFPY
jgi:uncharacterized protein YigE (DUF2233 family)